MLLQQIGSLVLHISLKLDFFRSAFSFSTISLMLVQDLPMDRKALEYVLEKARVDDVNITQEQGRQSLGALGLSGQMALARIGMSLNCAAVSSLYQCVWHHVRFCCS